MSRAAARIPPSPGAPRPPAPLHRGPARAPHPRPSRAAQGHPAPRRRLARPRSHPALLANDRVPRTGVRQASLCPRGRPPRKPRVFVCEVSVEPAYLAQRRAAPRVPLLAAVAGTLAAEVARGRFRRVVATTRLRSQSGSGRLSHPAAPRVRIKCRGGPGVGRGR